MPERIRVLQADIATVAVDAIVNAANERMLGGAGVDGAIHRAAGRELLEACRQVPEVRPGVRCPTGEARITPAFRLPAKWVIHTVGPVWGGGRAREADLLGACYRNSLRLAHVHGAASIALPAISCGVYRFPVVQAARIATTTLTRELARIDTLHDVVLVAFDAAMADVLRSALAEVGGTVEAD